MNSLMTLVDAATNRFAVNFNGRVYSCILPVHIVFDIIDVEWEEEEVVVEGDYEYIEVNPTRVIDPYTGDSVI